MKTIYTCGECSHYMQGRCGKTQEKTAEIVKACRSFELADDCEVDMVLADVPEAPTPKEETQICKVCGRELTLDHFGTAPRNPSKHFTTCKECQGRRSAEGKRRSVAAQKAAEEPVRDTKGHEDKNVTVSLSPADLSSFDDAQLLDELRRRGYSGPIRKAIVVYQNVML